jgi:hypothetical protein
MLLITDYGYLSTANFTKENHQTPETLQSVADTYLLMACWPLAIPL